MAHREKKAEIHLPTETLVLLIVTIFFLLLLFYILVNVILK